MENNQEKKPNRLLNYIKTVIFFRVSKEEKDYVKKESMKTDHVVFKRMLIIVFLCQIAMILFNLISNYGETASLRDNLYLITYLFLLASCAILYPTSDYLAKTNNYKGYFILVPIAVNIIFIWGCSITFIDSMTYSIELTTFSYISLALTAFVLMEPWLFILDSIFYSVLMLCLFINVPEISEQYHVGVVISLISISLLTCLAATANFQKKIEMLKIQKENEDLTESLKSSAFKDELTKVYNRRFLTEHIDDAVNIGLHPSGALMIDIDHFKMINDQYGHQNGDIILRDVSAIIKKHSKKLNNAYTVRYGGEEFLIFIQHTNPNEMLAFAENLRKEVEATDFELKDGTVIKVRISVGCSVATAGINFTRLINLADNNLYDAKNTGRNKVVFK